MSERRLHPRLDVPLEAWYRLEDTGDERVATLVNLSAGGAALQLAQTVAVGDRLYVRFCLPAEDAEPVRPIETSAEIVQVVERDQPEGEGGNVAGLKFIDLPQKSFTTIQQFVFSRLTKGHPLSAEIPFERRRVTVKRPIAVRFSRFDEFENEVSENVSMSGMFIRSSDPKSPGSVLSFEHYLGDDFPLLTGTAEVVWTRKKSMGRGRPPGMGVRFLTLDSAGRNVLHTLIEGRKPEPQTFPGGLPPTSDLPRPPKAPQEEHPGQQKAKVGEKTPQASEIGKLRQELRRRTKQYVEQEERLKTQIMELTNLEVDNEEKLRAAEDSLARVEAEKTSMKDLLSDLEALVLKESKKNKALDEGLRKATAERDELSQRVESLGSTAQEEISSLTANLEAAVRAERNSTERASVAEAKIEDLESQRNELRQTLEDACADLEREREAGGETERALRADLEAKTSSETDSRQRGDDLEARVAEQDQKVAALESAREDLERALVEARAELETTRNHSRESEEGLRGDLEARREEEDKLLEKVADLERDLEARATAEASLARKVADLEANAVTQEERSKALGHQRDELNQALAAAREDLDLTRAEGEQVEETLRAELDAEVEHARVVQHRVAGLEADLTAKSGSEADLQQRIAELEEEAASDGRRAEDLEAEIARLEVSLEEAERSHREKVEALEAACRGLNAELMRVQAEAESEGAAEEEDEEAKEAEGVEEIEIQEEPSTWAAIPEAALVSAPPSRRRSLPTSALAVVGLLLVGTVLFVFSRLPAAENVQNGAGGDARQVEQVSEETDAGVHEAIVRKDAGGSPQQTEAVVDRPPQKAADTTAPDPSAGLTVVEKADQTATEQVRLWAKAWSEQDVEDYLAFYSTQFVPADWMTRDQWETQRRQRLLAPSEILLGLESIREKEIGPGHVEVAFEQSYTADAYSDRVLKTLTLLREQGEWRIASERAEPL